MQHPVPDTSSKPRRQGKACKRLLTESQWAVGHWADLFNVGSMRCHNCPKEKRMAKIIKLNQQLCGSIMQDHADKRSAAWIGSQAFHQQTTAL